MRIVLLLCMLLVAAGCGERIEVITGSAETASGGFRTPLVHYSFSSRRDIRRLEIFCFNDDPMQRIDAHAVYENEIADGYVEFASRAGEKIVVAIANADSIDARKIYCYSDLARTKINLRDDSPDYPVMVCESAVRAGNGFRFDLRLEPVCSRVRLVAVKSSMGSLFSLKNARCYLINVNSSLELLQYDRFYPTDIINAWRLSNHDLESMRREDMIVRYFSKPIDGNGIYENICLYCYPNGEGEESLSSPYTRLVIEGTINGETRYFVAPLGKIGRNGDYVLRLDLVSDGDEKIRQYSESDRGYVLPVSARTSPVCSERMEDGPDVGIVWQNVSISRSCGPFSPSQDE